MKVLAKNLEILLLNNNLVMVPGLGGFLVDNKQAEFDSDENNLMLPPGRFIVFNKELKTNDGLIVHAYMQNYDATYPQALKQLEIDVQEINDLLDENGWVVPENIGTLRKNLEGHISFEQQHTSVITPSLFALPAIRLKSVAELEKERDIISNIEQTAALPVAKHHDADERTTVRRRWRDVAISSAAAVAMFFLFAFPYLNKDGQTEKTIAGAGVHDSSWMDHAEEQVKSGEEINARAAYHEVEKKDDGKTIVQPQIILLQTAPQAYNNTLVISQQDIDKANNLNTADGRYSIVVAAAANEQCGQYLISQLEEQNLPGAFMKEVKKVNYVLYSRFNSYNDAQKTLTALKKVNKKFQNAWVLDIQ